MHAIIVESENRKFFFIAKGLNHAVSMFNEHVEIPVSEIQNVYTIYESEMKEIVLTPKMCDVLSDISAFEYFTHSNTNGLFVAEL